MKTDEKIHQLLSGRALKSHNGLYFQKFVAEEPPEAVDLQTLANTHEWLELLQWQSLATTQDIERLSSEATAFVVLNPALGLGHAPGLVSQLVKLGKPVIPGWDHWGIAVHGRMLREVVEDAGGICFVPYGIEDVKRIMSVLRAIVFVRNLRVVYVGFFSEDVQLFNPDIHDTQARFGAHIHQIAAEYYHRAIEEADETKAKELAYQWAERREIIGNRKSALTEHAKVHFALKKLLEDNKANAITVDRTSYYPGLVPCFPYALLIDEGIPCGCEGDINALLTMSMLMGLSGKAVLMGNFFANITHAEIASNILTVNHDVLPPSMCRPGCPIQFHGFHGEQMGLTGYSELIEGKTVTLAGMSRRQRKMWCGSGKIAFTRDAVHCRVNIGVQMQDVRRIGRESFGHHICLTYGDLTQELTMLAQVYGIDLLRLE